MKKILYISYDGLTDWLGQSQVLPYLGGLSLSGYEIHIISFEKESALRMNEQKVRQIIQKHGLIWHQHTYTAKPKIVSTLLDVYRMRTSAIRLHKRYGFDIVHARSYIPALVALHLKQKYGVRCVFDMRGLWVDERVEGKIWNIRNPVYKMIYSYFKKSEKKLLRYSDVVVSVSHAAVPVLFELAQNTALNVHVIPCGADFELFDYQKISEAEQADARSKLKIQPEDKVLSYLGSIGTWYMLDEMLQFFRLAQKKGAFSKFLFITRENVKMIKWKAGKSGIDPRDIIVVSAVRDEVPAYLSVSEANIFFIKQSFSKKASSPVKFAEALGMGIPVIANAGVGDIEKHFSEADIGILLKSFSEKSMHDAIDLFPELQNISKESIRQLAIKYFDLKKGIEAYKKIYDQCLESPGSRKEIIPPAFELVL